MCDVGVPLVIGGLIGLVWLLYTEASQGPSCVSKHEDTTVGVGVGIVWCVLLCEFGFGRVGHRGAVADVVEESVCRHL